MITKLSSAFAFVALIGLLSAGSPSRAQGERKLNFPMVLVVTDTTGLATDKQPLYFASNVNGWNPGDPAWKLTRAGEGAAAVWELPLKAEQLAAGGVEFKITRGSWETVEVTSEGTDMSNRKLDEGSWTMDGARLALKVEVAGFVDQRGTRWNPARATAMLATAEPPQQQAEQHGAGKACRHAFDTGLPA